MQPNNSSGQSPARTAPPSAVPAASPRGLLASLPQDIPRPLTSNEPMIISPPNAGLGSFGITRSPFTPMQAMPTIMDTLSGVQMMVPRDNQNMAEPSDSRVMLTPNGHRFITCFITRCREVKVAPSLSLLLHVFHVNQSGLFLHLQPMSRYSFVTSIPSLIKNWKEKFVYVSYNPRAGYSFSTTWVQFVSPFTLPSYECLDVDRTKLCGDGPFDHRRYHDPLLVNQLNDGPPLPPVSSTPSMLRVYNTQGKPTSSHTQSDDEESSVGVMADPTLDGVESGAIFSPSRTAPPQVITINSPDHARVDRPSGPLPGSLSIEYDPHDPLLMDALSSHLVGDLMNASMQAIGIQQRLQEASQDYAASEEALRELGDCHQQLQDEYEKQQVAHTHALEHAIEDWQGTEDFSRAADDYACSRMLGLLRYWLPSPDCSGQAMVDAMPGCIAGWKLPEYLPLCYPPAPVMPASTTTPADGFLMSLERAGRTSSMALSSDSVGGFGSIWECGSVIESPLHLRVWFLKISSRFCSSVGIIFPAFL
nr:protein Daple-like [Ipomoea batatas]